MKTTMKLIFALAIFCSGAFAGDQGNGGLYCNPNDPATQCCEPNDQTQQCGSAASGETTTSFGDSIFYLAEEIEEMAKQIAHGLSGYVQ